MTKGVAKLTGLVEAQTTRPNAEVGGKATQANVLLLRAQATEATEATCKAQNRPPVTAKSILEETAKVIRGVPELEEIATLARSQGLEVYALGGFAGSLVNFARQRLLSRSGDDTLRRGMLEHLEMENLINTATTEASRHPKDSPRSRRMRSKSKVTGIAERACIISISRRSASTSLAPAGVLAACRGVFPRSAGSGTSAQVE